jgi:rare lipoprotein A
MKNIWKHIFVYFLIADTVLSLIGCTASPKFRRDEARRPTMHWVPSEEPFQIGNASYYAEEFHGRDTSSGETFDMYALTAAHNTLPLGTIVKVTNLGNHKSVIVKINDRGPFVGGRIIDLSYGAARELGMIGQGVVRVRIDIVELGEDK